MRGRKPKPTALKVVAGTRPDRVNAAEPKPAHGQPLCPEHLDDDAQAEWSRVTAILDRMGVLTEADGGALAIYCEAWSRKRAADGEIARHGLLIDASEGGLKANPAVSIAKACDTVMLRVLASFGLTPADRSRVKAREEGPKDALAELIARRKAR